ncbi:unnamed protein product, partial [Ectocarpus sp. 8 AP-2014]
GSLTLPGTQDEINAALLNVWYSAPPDWNSLGQDTFETLSVLVDEQDSAQGGDPYPGVPRTLIVLIAPINDPPLLRGPSEFTAVEGRTTVLGGIEVSDVDAQDTTGSVLEVTVSSAEKGSNVELGANLGLFIKNSSDESKTFQGSVTNINKALAGLTFRGAFEFSGATTFKVEVDDMGNTGGGGALSDSLSIPIHVSSVNNPPRVTREQGLLLEGVEDEVVPVDGIMVEDQDAGGGRVKLTIEARHGKISLGGNPFDLEFDRGKGSLDDEVVVFGTIEVRNVPLH